MSEYEMQHKATPSLDQHVLWSYGSGNVGIGDGELSGPHTADENPLNPDEIVVAEQYGNDILVINRSTGRMRVLYGERGVAGEGKQLSAAHSAHFMPSGPYRGHVLITGVPGLAKTLLIRSLAQLFHLKFNSTIGWIQIEKCMWPLQLNTILKQDGHGRRTRRSL